MSALPGASDTKGAVPLAGSSESSRRVLEVVDAEVRFPGRHGLDATPLLGVTLGVSPAEVLGVVGETGAGKSLTAWTAVGMIPPPGVLSRGEVRYRGRVIGSADGPDWRQVRGRALSIIVQDPAGALNPVLTIGSQIANVYTAHNRESKRRSRDVAVEALRKVGIHSPEQRARAYPHQLSGGMAQRAMIAMALVNNPEVLIADEPTTGLDTTVQVAILDLMIGLVRERHSALWLITHDLGVIANYTDRTAVMFAGQVVEEGPTSTLFEAPRHPYTQALIAAAADDRPATTLVSGAPPDTTNRPRGCQFASRCPIRQPRCEIAMPPLDDSVGHLVRCVVVNDPDGAQTQAAP